MQTGDDPRGRRPGMSGQEPVPDAWWRGSPSLQRGLAGLTAARPAPLLGEGRRPRAVSDP